MPVITEKDDVFRVRSPFNRAWIKRAHELNGTWKAPYWCFALNHEGLVREALMEIYGEDGTPIKRIIIEITLDPNISYENELIVAGVQIAARRHRDADVKMCNGTVLVSGGFSKSAGSAKHPKIGNPDPDTVIRTEIPKTMFKKTSDEYPSVTIFKPTKKRERRTSHAVSK